ncbi:hypothetical protein CLG85_015885 [Yangia mangrovi]|uniref:VPLPA-CTERM protein sorting domain-containing protein n=1 Tax=Alloyangia mangrovi TaxID=1779329 RepID=A0A2A3K1Z6_9RHOB|nr:hypothetical protein [Alloyangia mangrovi]MCT4371719.1 hypothetical protein [Alloyangia mangrovi]
MMLLKPIICAAALIAAGSSADALTATFTDSYYSASGVYSSAFDFTELITAAADHDVDFEVIAAFVSFEGYTPEVWRQTRTSYHSERWCSRRVWTGYAYVCVAYYRETEATWDRGDNIDDTAHVVFSSGDALSDATYALPVETSTISHSSSSSTHNTYTNFAMFGPVSDRIDAGAALLNDLADGILGYTYTLTGDPFEMFSVSLGLEYQGYDASSVAPVPLPGAFSGLLGAVAGIGLFARRRKGGAMA